MELFEAAHWFVEFGANPIARDKMGMTPWDIWLQLAKGEEEKLDLLNIEFIRRSCDNGTQLSTSDFRRQSTEDLFTDWSIPGWIDAQISARMPVRDMTWLRMNKNNDAIFTVLIKEVSSAWGYDLNTTALALQFFSRTFMQHDAAMQLLRFREPSYNTFELKQDETSIQDGEPEQDEKGNQEGKPEQDKSNANILSLVIPYLHSRRKGSIIKDREDMEAYRSKVLDKNAGIESLHSDIEQRELKHLVRRFKNIHSTNTHEPRTLDESHYLGLSNEQLSDRNKDQVVSRSEEKEEDRRVLMVSQLWLWRMDDVIVSACGSHSEEGSLDAGLDPQACLSQEFERGYLGTGNGVPALQLAALLFSECVNYIDRPYCAGLEEPVFYTFEKAVAMLNDEVKSYINHRAIEKIYLDKEMEFIHQIGDIRDELSIIRNVITEQKEIWDKFRKDLKDEIPKWKYINRSVALRPEEQIPKFLRRVEKIDEDAKRVEERIQVQLDLKKTHAGLKESHNSAVLSSAVIGFTIITIIFAPLSFMTSLLAVPGVELKWDWATGKKYLTVAEVLSLVATLGLVWLSLFLLKKKETLGVGARISSGFQSKKEKSKRKESTNGTQSERTGMKYFTERSKKKTTDIEQAHPPNPS